MTFATAVELTPKVLTPAGVDLSLPAQLTAVSANGNKFVFTPGKTILLIYSTNASPVTVTFEIDQTLQGLAVVDPTASLTQNQLKAFGAFLDIFKYPGTQMIWFTCSPTATVYAGILYL